MIGQLRGPLAEKRPESVLVDVGGVGYEVRVPLSTYLELPEVGEGVSLRIHTHVREDQLVLYGFATDVERLGFGLLLRVNGVGPRLALAILSGLPVPRLVVAVTRGDPAAIRAVPGVGAKTAERILIELKDKVDRLADVAPADRADIGEADQEAISALTNLGYPTAQAEKAVRRAQSQLEGEGPLTLEALIREALRVAAG